MNFIFNVEDDSRISETILSFKNKEINANKNSGGIKI